MEGSGESRMNTALSLWGYEIDGKTLIVLIGAYLAVSLVLIVYIPRYAVPISLRKDDDGHLIDLTSDERSKIIDMRAKVRTSVTQVTGGILVLATFIGTLQTLRSTEDTFNQKKAELFATNVKKLLAPADRDNNDATRSEAIYVLQFVARSDHTYHRAVFDALASYVRTSGTCADKDRVMQLAMRAIGERRTQDDPTGKHFNLEHACYDGLDLQDERGVVKGLSRTRMSAANMHHVDFGKAEMQGTDFIGIFAEDYSLPEWRPEIGNGLNWSAADPRPNCKRHPVDGDVRRHFVAHFIEANLQNANFTGAHLQGADFSRADLTGANFDSAAISRVNFRDALGLEPRQLVNACVGSSSMSKEELLCEQPYFSDDFQKRLKADKYLSNGIHQCGVAPGG
jgi:uncharacterized protein YjbI with pentapeptide repeats